MKVAQIAEFGQSPAIHTISSLPAPTEDEIQLKILATGIHQLVRSRAAGKHYSAKGLPHTPGVDAVGEDVNNPSDRYYFGSITPKGGTLQEAINIDRRAAVRLPADITGDQIIQIAASMNPLMASWMAFAKRIDWSSIDQTRGFACLIIGATTFSGKMAIATARQFGATRVIGCARTAKNMENLGLDEMIELAENPAETDFSSLVSETKPIDIVIDFLYGEPALAFFKTILTPKPLQYVQAGSVAGLDIQFPAAALRSKDITVRGTGPGSWRKESFFHEAKGMAEFLVSGKVVKGSVSKVKFEEIESRWDDEKKADRVVVVM